MMKLPDRCVTHPFEMDWTVGMSTNFEPLDLSIEEGFEEDLHWTGERY